MERAARTVGAAAAVAGGLALGFLAERRFVHQRLQAPPLPAGVVPLGSIAGEVRTVPGPDGMDLTIETYGPPDAPQLVLSHGWICTGRAWHHQVAALADRYRIITYDQPGHGRTSSPESSTYDLDLLGDTLRVVIEAASVSGPLVLAGHSMGGMAVLNAIHRHDDLLDDRVGGVALLSTTSKARADRIGFEVGISGLAKLERGIQRIVPVLRDPRVVSASERLYRSSSDLSTLLVRRIGVGPDADPQVVAFVEQLVLDSDPDIVLGLAAAVLGVDVEAGLSRLRVPTSIFVGSDDRLTPVSLSERMAKRSGAELHVLDGVGHMSLLEAPDEINRALIEHLDRVATEPYPREVATQRWKGARRSLRGSFSAGGGAAAAGDDDGRVA